MIGFYQKKFTAPEIIPKTFEENRTKKAYNWFNMLCNKKTKAIFKTYLRTVGAFCKEPCRKKVKRVMATPENNIKPTAERTDTPPTMKVFLNAIYQRKNNKATEPVHLKIAVLIDMPSVQIEMYLWVQTMEEKTAEEDIIMIYKRKNSADTSNYKPFTLLNHTLKTLTRMINVRFNPTIKETI